MLNFEEKTLAPLKITSYESWPKSSLNVCHVKGATTDMITVDVRVPPRLEVIPSQN